MIFALDLDKRYLLFNEAHSQSMKKRYGIDIQKGVSILEYVDAESDIGVGDELFDRIIAGEKITFEAEFGNDSLFRGHTELHAFPLKNDNGDTFGVAVFAHDISTKMKLLLQNYHYSRLMENIVSDLSHKLRKPVATILGLTQLLDTEKENKELAEILKYIKVSTEELDKHLRQMTVLLEKKPNT
jgi:signal transduction histidine kinase